MNMKVDRMQPQGQDEIMNHATSWSHALSEESAAAWM